MSIPVRVFGRTGRRAGPGYPGRRPLDSSGVTRDRDAACPSRSGPVGRLGSATTSPPIHTHIPHLRLRRFRRHHLGRGSALPWFCATERGKSPRLCRGAGGGSLSHDPLPQSESHRSGRSGPYAPPRRHGPCAAADCRLPAANPYRCTIGAAALPLAGRGSRPKPPQCSPSSLPNGVWADSGELVSLTPQSGFWRDGPGPEH